MCCAVLCDVCIVTGEYGGGSAIGVHDECPGSKEQLEDGKEKFSVE